MPGSDKPFARFVFAGLLAAAAVAASGCEEYRARRNGVTFEGGNAVAHNIAVHTIDPWPPYVRSERVDLDGERGLIAIQRYKANKSIPPKGIATQTVTVPTGGTGQ